MRVLLRIIFLVLIALFNSERGLSMQTDPSDCPKIAYSIKEACKASSLGRTTIYSHIASGRLLARRIGGRTVIPAESLHALIVGEE